MALVQIDALTPREREILTLIAEGDSLPEIAQKLHRSLKTVETHRLSIGRKLKAGNRIELVKIAIAAGLIEVERQQRPSQPDNGSTSSDAQFELAWIEKINKGVFNTSGAAFMQRLCNLVSMLPGITTAAICVPDESDPTHCDPYSRLVMASAQHGLPGELMRYEAIGTPCQTIIDQGNCFVSSGVCEQYPQDAWLKALSAQCYFAVQVCDKDGKVLGGFGLVGDKPIDSIFLYKRILEFYAPRIAAELQVCKEIDRLRTRCEQLEEELRLRLVTGPHTTGSPIFLRVSQAIHDLSGTKFLRRLVDVLCDELNVRMSAVCRLVEENGEQLLASIVVKDEESLIDVLRYRLPHSPCERAIEKGFLSLPVGVLGEFPNGKDIQSLGADAYMGIRLNNPDGEVLGLLWVLDMHRIEHAEVAEQLLKFLAPRVSAELANFIAIEDLLQQREALMEQLRQM